MITVMHCVPSVQATDFFRGLADRHNRSQVRMLVAALGKHSQLHEDLQRRGIPVWSLEFTGKLTWPSTAIRLARLLRQEHVDVLHLHLFEPTLIGVVAGRLAGVKAIVNTRHHANLHLLLRKPWHIRLDGWMAKRANRVIAVSGQVKKVLTQIENVSADNVEVIHPGCDLLDECRSDRAACDGLRRFYGIPQGNKVIGMVARLHPIKGHSILLQALARLNGSVPAWTLLLMGQGPLRQQLEKQVHDLHLAGRVVFTGFVDTQQRLTCYSLMDILAHPSYEDAAPMPIIEAMAFSIPVIATPCGHVPEVVEDGKCGRIIPIGQVQPLVDALKELLSDDDLRFTMGTAAKQRVVTGFRWSDMARAYEVCYAKVLGLPMLSPLKMNESIVSANPSTSISYQR